jgi:hypothetical protein
MRWKEQGKPYEYLLQMSQLLLADPHTPPRLKEIARDKMDRPGDVMLMLRAGALKRTELNADELEQVLFHEAATRAAGRDAAPQFPRLSKPGAKVDETPNGI